MKSLLTLPRPRRADRTRAPAAMAAVLVAMVGVQLALPTAAELPDPGVIPPLRLQAVQPQAMVAEPVILARALFAPSRRNDLVAAGPGGASTGPLGGVTAIGVMRSRAGVRVFLQSLDGTVRAMSPGGSFDGWRLTRVEPDAIVFVRESQSLRLPLAPSRPAVPVAAVSPTEEEQP